MTEQHRIHDNHTHIHGADCGHTSIIHNGHVDFIHDGHLHSLHEGHYDEHALEIGRQNPAACTPDHVCSGHDSSHRHGQDCGHEAIPHGDHVDYLVAGHLHYPDGDHCDNHGNVALA